MGWNPTLEKATARVRRWLEATYSQSQIGRAIQVRPDDGEFGSIHIKIWTGTNEYRIRVSLKSPRLGDAYMGASASTRKPRTGETWTRGNDLPDGRFSAKLWHRILVAIVRYEAQEIKSESWKEERPEPPGEPATRRPDDPYPVWRGLMRTAYARWKSGDLGGEDRAGFLAALDETHRDAVMLGNLNYQVENGGFGQWIGNGFGAEIAAVRSALQRLGTVAARLVDAMLARLEPHINCGSGAGHWVMGETYEKRCPDCEGNLDTDCDSCWGSGRVREEPESDGWDIAKSLGGEYDAVRDALAEGAEAWFATKAV